MAATKQREKLQTLESELAQTIGELAGRDPFDLAPPPSYREVLAMLRIIHKSVLVLRAMEEPLDRHGIEKCQQDLLNTFFGEI